MKPIDVAGTRHGGQVIVGSPDRRRPLNILVFAYVYPPDAGSGTYRTLYFANHWARQGDHVTVVTVREECFVASALIDRALCDEVDASIQVVRAAAKRPLERLLAIKRFFRHATTVAGSASAGGAPPLPEDAASARGVVRRFKDTITDLLSCPDEHIGWVADAVRRAYRIAKTDRIDCIYATGGPWSCLLAGARLHRLTGIPLLLDFRDPWVSNPNMSRKTPLSRWIQKRMESRCVKAASVVIANTEELRRDFMARYGENGSRRFITVTNGFEQIPRENNRSTELFTLVHAGALYQSRNPLNFLKALAELVRDGTIPAKRFRVRLVGGVSIADPAIESTLRADAIREVVEIVPRVSHEEALRLQQRASALILIQTGFPLQVPRKMYEYLALARPILAVAEPHSATARMVSELGAGYVADDDVNAIKRAIASLYDEWKSGRRQDLNTEKLQAYDNRHLSARIREAMRGLARTG
jgi:glycosyltransferase involved in cell wall biosynthesis